MIPSVPLSRIFLIGYRGVGKSNVARFLASRLGWSWSDADVVLESHHGRSIRQIFEEEGEEGFRDKESAILDELCRLERHVLATGGGVVLRESNREKLRAAGLLIWLTADTATIHQRLQADPSGDERRPVLTVGGVAEIEDLLRTRRPLYQDCADLTIDTVGRSAEEIAAEIEAWIKGICLTQADLTLSEPRA